MTPFRRIANPFIRPAPILVSLFCVSLVTSVLMVVHPRHAAATTPSPPSGWSTVFTDDFGGAANSALGGNWVYDLGTSYPGGAAAWGTGEVETATNAIANVHQDGAGHLIIKPIRDASGHWTSGRVETRRTDFAAPVGGELEMTASVRQPNPAVANGYWPAFWALGAAARPVSAANWPSIGELDIMEDINGLSNVSHTFHCGVWGQPPCNEPNGISSGLLACSGCQTGYHTYSVIVDRTKPQAEQLRFETDGVVQYKVNQNQVSDAIWAAAVDHGFFLIFDVAIGGSYPDKACGCNSLATVPTSGADMGVDYVAVYEKQAGPATNPTPTPTRTVTPTPTATRTATPTRTVAPTPTATSPRNFVGAQSRIQSENRNSQEGTRTEQTADTGGGLDVGWIGNGDLLRFDKVSFGATPLTQLHVRLASGAAAGVSGLVELHLDSPRGPAIGSVEVASTGGWQSWRTVAANISPTTGAHTVYVEFVSGSAHDFVNLNWLTFAP